MNIKEFAIFAVPILVFLFTGINVISMMYCRHRTLKNSEKCAKEKSPTPPKVAIFLIITIYKGR
jgi:hypothetical protein